MSIIGALFFIFWVAIMLPMAIGHGDGYRAWPHYRYFYRLAWISGVKTLGKFIGVLLFIALNVFIICYFSA